jgi:hypothetical protein
MSYLVQFAAGTHPVGCAATPLGVTLAPQSDARKCCARQIVRVALPQATYIRSSEGIFRRGIFGKDYWFELIEVPYCRLGADRQRLLTFRDFFAVLFSRCAIELLFPLI